MASHLLISGTVQGVGYRAAMVREATRLGVSGWVRNLKDGRVEALVDGPSAPMIIDWARRGPPSARVEHVAVSQSDQICDGFRQLPTA